MKQIIIVCLALFIVIISEAQIAAQKQNTGYEAATWKTWLLDSTKIKSIPPPPLSQSRSELRSIKERIGKLDEKQLDEITYWNAGAPSYRWNQIVIKLLEQKFDVQLRMPASWMNVAIYDATILAWKEKLKYKRKRPNVLDPSLSTAINAPLTYSYPCEHSVTAAAAATVLAYFFPAKADSIMQMAHTASQSRIEAGVQFESDAEAGWNLGEQVALQIIEKAKNDGSSKKWDGNMNKGPKKWTGKYPMGITLASFMPIVIHSADQFRLPPPPDFEKDMQELKNFKQTFKSKASAYYWASTGPEVWNDLASQKMFEYRLSDDAPAVARIYTVMNVAYHDAVIAIFDSKYTYWGTRPDQYDTTYKPLINTPPFPGYPSGHAAGAATSSTVLSYFFPADAKQFKELAQQCADSRFYAGIHFRTDNETALQMGEQLGNYIVKTWMEK